MATKARRSEQDGLNDKQAHFCREYLVDFNATQAAIRAGYSKRSAHVQAAGLLKNPKVEAKLGELAKEHANKADLSVERVLKEAMRLAFFDIRKLVDANGNPLRLHELDDDTAAAVMGLDITTIGNADVGIGEVRKYKIADKNSALERLFKHLGLFAKDNEQNNPMRAMQELMQLVNGSKLPIASGSAKK
jgi:phage terminase small subunit